MIAQHGYTHTYVTRNGGMLKVNRQSEFAGLSSEEQREKLAKGQEILQKQGICARMFNGACPCLRQANLKGTEGAGLYLGDRRLYRSRLSQIWTGVYTLYRVETGSGIGEIG